MESHKVPLLSDRVICDPNLIFRPLTLIIADSFGSAQHDPLIAKEIRETGIVPLETFNKACKKDSSSAEHKSLSIKELVELLKHHNILSEITQNGESVLFMPCLLQPYSASNDDQQLSKDDYLNAFLFTFTPYGFQPIGLFYALTAKLLSSKDFELSCTRYRNKIEFLYGNTYINISSMFHYLQVCVDQHCRQNRRVNLRSILHKQVNSIMNKLPHTRNCKAEVSFYCPVSISNKTNPLHVAKLVEVEQMDFEDKPRILDCKHCKIKDLTKEQEMWFKQQQDPSYDCTSLEKTLDNPVHIDKALKLMKSHSSDWEEIGQCLGIDQNTRDAIKQVRGNRPNILLEAVLNQWVEINEEATWRTLVKALKEAELNHLANNLEEGVTRR